MDFKQNIAQEQKQQIVLNQKLRQSVEILAMSRQELQERIAQELIENPVLEEDIVKEKEPVEKQERSQESYALSYEDRKVKTDQKHHFIQNSLEAEQSLSDYLLEQLLLSNGGKSQTMRAERKYKLAEIIISALDERGFLQKPLEALFDYEELQEAQEVLHSIQAPRALGMRLPLCSGSPFGAGLA